MSYKDKVNSEVKAFTSRPTRGSVSNVTTTNLSSHLKGLHEELQRQVIPTAVGYAATVVRKKAVEIVRRGGTETRIGKSYKTKTRGVPGARGGMTNVGRGAWSRMIAKKRGQRGPSLADAGGIIKRPIRRRMKGLLSSQIVGPKYNPGPAGKNFAHVHEPADGKRSRHVFWGRAKSGIHKVRPFMGPAGKMTEGQQLKVIKKALKRWDIRGTDFD